MRTKIQSRTRNVRTNEALARGARGMNVAGMSGMSGMWSAEAPGTRSASVSDVKAAARGCVGFARWVGYAAVRRTVLLAVLLAPLAPAPAQETGGDSALSRDAARQAAQDAADDSPLARGKAVYDVWCVICHGENDHASGGGTAALEFLYRGALPAKLEDRTDMTAELITELVRRGRFGMPNFRLTEIDEGQLQDLIAYLQRNNPGRTASDDE